MFLKRQYGDEEVECRFCHQKIKPIIKLNRVKSEFYGSKYTGNDKTYWLVCPKCKAIIGTK